MTNSLVNLQNKEATKWWVLMAVGLGTFMTAMDSSIVNTVLPVISRYFAVDVAAVEWVVTVYLLMLSGFLLGFGRLGDLRGHKIVYLTGFGLFTFSSALCGFAPNVWILVAARGLQATGGAMLAANSPAILTKSFPASQRGQALGLQATMTYLGLTVGPSLGGWLAHFINWRVVFYINIPISLLAIWLSCRSIASDSTTNKTEQFDIRGMFIFFMGLVALLLGLNQGHNLGWTSPVILSLLVISVGLLVLFVWIENKAPHPMLDLKLFQHPIFTLSTMSAIINYVCVYFITFLMPFYLIQGRSLNSSQAGLILTAQPIIMAIVAPLSGTLSDRLGTRWPSVLGMTILSVGIFLLSQLGETSPIWQVVVSLGVVGFGTGIFISPNNSALMGAAPRSRQGIAAGVLATARNFGMVLGVGISGAIFTSLIIIQQQEEVLLTGLFPAISTSYKVASCIAISGILTSMARGFPHQLKE